MSEQPRIIVRIELTAPAKERLNEVCDAKGMTQVALLSRLVEWFARQPEMVRAVVLGWIPEQANEGAATLVIKQLLHER